MNNDLQIIWELIITSLSIVAVLILLTLFIEFIYFKLGKASANNKTPKPINNRKDKNNNSTKIKKPANNSNANPFRNTEKEFLDGYNEMAKILGFNPQNMNALQHLTTDTFIHVMRYQDDELFGYNEPCIIDTTIFTTYCIGSTIYKIAKNKKTAEDALIKYQENILKSMLIWCDSEKSLLEEIWYNRLSYYNEIGKLENIIDEFLDILMHDKRENKNNIYTKNSPIVLIGFDEMFFYKEVIYNYCISTTEMFAQSIKEVVETL